MARSRTYSTTQKHQAVALYVATGSTEAAGRQLGIPGRTIRSWKDQEWWNEVYFHAKARMDEELEGIYTQAINLAAREVTDRLQNGDYRVAKDGAQFRVPVSGRDAALIQAICFDKRQLLRNSPTRIDQSTTDLKKLAESFEALAIRNREKVIEHE